MILGIKREFQDKLCANLVKNCVDYIFPELVTRTLEKNSKQLLVQTVKSDNKKYCICKTVAEREMVGCGMCADWFHPACLKLSKLPTSKAWYCPMCKKAKKQKLDKKHEPKSKVWYYVWPNVQKGKKKKIKLYKKHE